ncbi:hypothetical protein GQ607_005449 [Colletotrichum asianum]|uniref:Uncharacterized protein n=1 Tax=Colletotrichum asianum TaxID=702518 RepID=A0A8H3WIU3_9PEZI|nr:hypothetical protein GQ607_005449 [Colletotrichum asianum]
MDGWMRPRSKQGRAERGVGRVKQQLNRGKVRSTLQRIMNVVDDGRREKPEGHALQTGFVGIAWEARFELDAMR